MKFLLALLFLPLATPILAQEYLLLNRAEIKDHFGSDGVYRDSAEYLFAALSETYKDSPMEAIYHFNKDSICDHIEYRYYCGPCFNKYQNDLTKDRFYKWREIGDKHYLSKRRFYLEGDTLSWEDSVRCVSIQLQDTPDQPYCATATYTFFVTDYDTWRRLTQRQNRIRRKKQPK